jgi:diguanylate cyclase (GGDEF)-like protein
MTKRLIAGALLFLGLHICLVHAAGAERMALSYCFTLLAPLLGLISCLRFRNAATSTIAWKWIALCVGCVFWEAGMAIAAWEDLRQINTYHVTATAGFIYFLFGAPLLLAICASRNDNRLPAIAWIDGIMAVAIGVLAYLELFSYLPGLSPPELQPAATRVAYIYDAENLFLALLASVRLLAAESRQERLFYRAVAVFLWSYAGTAAFYNHIVELHWNLSVGSPLDAVVDIPFLILAGLALSTPYQVSEPVRERNRIAVTLIQASISTSLPLVLLILGILAIPRSPTLGVIAAVGSLAGYALRSTLNQARLQESEDRLLESRKVLEQAALIDPLTGVGNRRAFDQALQSEWVRSARTRQPLALLIIDVDHFKLINDQYGHQMGDRVLTAVAQGLAGALPRVIDVIARYGGEEFACLLPATDRPGALAVAERLRAAVQALQIAHPNSDHRVLTVSIGAAVGEIPRDIDLHSLIESADRALYTAKNAGRNRVELAFDPTAYAEIKAS